MSDLKENKFTPDSSVEPSGNAPLAGKRLLLSYSVALFGEVLYVTRHIVRSNFNGSISQRNSVVTCFSRMKFQLKK